MIICHRVNTIEKLKRIPEKYGVEIDVRFDTGSGRLYLHHDNQSGKSLEACAFLDDYLKHYHHRFVIFNIKDTGTEQACIDLAAQFNIPKENYFLLDVEFPYVFYATRDTDRAGNKKVPVREIAIRYSEAEPIEQALVFKRDRNSPTKPIVDWVWIDTNTVLPLDKNIVTQLEGFLTCLVCPERWGRPQDIEQYAQKIKALNFKLDAVMTALEYATVREESGAVRI